MPAGKWAARIYFDGLVDYLGLYPAEEEVRNPPWALLLMVPGIRIDAERAADEQPPRVSRVPNPTISPAFDSRKFTRGSTAHRLSAPHGARGSLL